MLDIKKIENFADELKKNNNFKAMQNALFKNSINSVSTWQRRSAPAWSARSTFSTNRASASTAATLSASSEC